MSKSEQEFELFDPSSEYKNRKSTNTVGDIVGKVGIVTGLGIVGYMARSFKNKPKDMKLSVYLIHTRMFAQGSVIGVLSLGMMYQMFQKYQDQRLAALENTQPR